MRVYFHHCLYACSCIHSMFSVHTITNISSSSTINRSTDVPSIVPMQVSMRILLIMCTNHCTLFYDKLVVDMCIYTLAIACMYSLHACTFIHSMFSVHACSCFYSMFSVHTITNICASSTTTDRLMFHELFPCKYSCAYSSSCAHTIAHYIVVVF